ncbi:hypothetical protein MRX96_032742 [Rhipicephalus microplus]
MIRTGYARQLNIWPVSGRPGSPEKSCSGEAQWLSTADGYVLSTASKEGRTKGMTTALGNHWKRRPAMLSQPRGVGWESLEMTSEPVGIADAARRADSVPSVLERPS